MAVIGRNITIRGGILPSVDLEINNVNEGTFAAGSTVDVQLTDGTNPVTPDSVTVVGNTVTIDVPDSSPTPVDTSNIFSTGQAGDPNKDYWLISANVSDVNVWGHRFRWCGYTGGYTDGVGYFDKNGVATTKVLAFPETVGFDMGTVNNSTGEVFQFQLNFIYTGNTTRALAEAACAVFSTASFPSSWRMPTYPELIRFFYQPVAFLFEQLPFESLGPFYSQWCSTDSIVAGNGFTLVANRGEMAQRVITTNAGRAFPVRTANISELTI